MENRSCSKQGGSCTVWVAKHFAGKWFEWQKWPIVWFVQRSIMGIKSITRIMNRLKQSIFHTLWCKQRRKTRPYKIPGGCVVVVLRNGITNRLLPALLCMLWIQCCKYTENQGKTSISISKTRRAKSESDRKTRIRSLEFRAKTGHWLYKSNIDSTDRD